MEPITFKSKVDCDDGDFTVEPWESNARVILKVSEVPNTNPDDGRVESAVLVTSKKARKIALAILAAADFSEA